MSAAACEYKTNQRTVPSPPPDQQVATEKTLCKPKQTYMLLELQIIQTRSTM